MSRCKTDFSELKPYISVFLLVGTLLIMVFCKMEVRRAGYAVLKAHKELRQVQNNHRSQLITYAQSVSPSHLRSLAASNLTMEEAKLGQVIQISSNNIVLKQ